MSDQKQKGRKAPRYNFATAEWDDREMCGLTKERRGWIRHAGIYDTKKKLFAPGATSMHPESLERYEWFKCRKRTDLTIKAAKKRSPK